MPLSLLKKSDEELPILPYKAGTDQPASAVEGCGRDVDRRDREGYEWCLVGSRHVGRVGCRN